MESKRGDRGWDYGNGPPLVGLVGGKKSKIGTLGPIVADKVARGPPLTSRPIPTLDRNPSVRVARCHVGHVKMTSQGKTMIDQLQDCTKMLKIVFMNLTWIKSI